MASAKQVLGVIGATVVLGAVGSTLGWTSTSMPEPQDVTIERGAAANVVIDDPNDVLTEEDEARLMRNSERLGQPAVVKNVHYMVFETNYENVSDNVEEYLADHHPELLDYNADTIADGALILALGLDPRMNGVYYGEDVRSELHLGPGSARDTQILDAKKPGVTDGNIAAGMFASADEAMNVDAAENYAVESAHDEQSSSAILGGAAGAGTGLIGGSGVAAYSNRRRKNLEQARADYEAVTTEYAQLAERLPEIDIRANSVSSSFADAQLRQEWGEVRDRFLSYHQAVSGVGGIGEINIDDDKEALRNRDRLRETAESVEHVSNAEDNIDRLFRIERGDAGTRRAGLTDIRNDVIQAKLKVRDEQLKAQLEDLERRINYMDSNAASPEFLNDFVRVLGDYRLLMDSVKRQEFSGVTEYEQLEAPHIYDPTYMYTGYVSYNHMDRWHRSNVEQYEQEQARQQSSSSSSASFSSGFGGSGSTSRF